MEQKLNRKILDFHHDLVKIKEQAKKLEDKLKKYSREWAQVASFKMKCEETQGVLARKVRRG